MPTSRLFSIQIIVCQMRYAVFTSDEHFTIPLQGFSNNREQYMADILDHMTNLTCWMMHVQICILHIFEEDTF